jgi:hypothetical protein
MKENAKSKFSMCVRRAAIAIVAIGIAVAPTIHAKPISKQMAGKPGDKIIVVRPTDLPELARQTGEAMLLHDTGDGRTLLYIEQNHGAQLAIFDVTDPSHIKGKDSVQLDAGGPFDFVSPLGDHAELVRFRESQQEAVLDLRKVKLPVIQKVQGPKLQGLIEPLGADGFIVVNQADGQPEPKARDYQIVETANSREPNRVFDVQQVRGEITNNDTGTTFLLTADGLYLVRRPAVEEEYNTHIWQLNRG